jgi:hypothetical protein
MKDLASGGFPSMGSTIFAVAAMRAASPIDLSDHAGFQQSTR